MKLEFPRGDSYERGVVLRNKSTGQPVTDTFDEVYFTVKKKAADSDYLFQKRMTTGGISNDGNGHYTLFIYPEDTNSMAFREYDCDFEFVKDNYKRTFAGTLKLTEEVTHQNNEVSGE